MSGGMASILRCHPISRFLHLFSNIGSAQKHPELLSLFFTTLVFISGHLALEGD